MSLYYITSSSVHHFKSIGEFQLELQSGNGQLGSKSSFSVPCDLEIWWMTLKNNRAPSLCCFKLCVSFHCHQWILTGVIVKKRPIRVKIDVFVPRDFEIWQMTLKNNTAPPWCHFKLCVSFRSHWWLQTGDTVQKRRILVKIEKILSVWPWNLSDDLEKH